MLIKHKQVTKDNILKNIIRTIPSMKLLQENVFKKQSKELGISLEYILRSVKNLKTKEIMFDQIFEIISASSQ